jgi:GH24 family phage-related lysozyme (muramidase)
MIAQPNPCSTDVGHRAQASAFPLLRCDIDVTLADQPSMKIDTLFDRLAAIVDFSFNLGAGRLQTSTLRRRINQRDWAAAGQELRRWVYGGGKVLPGLVTRREAEVTLLIAEVKISI